MFDRSKTTAYRGTGAAGVSIRWTDSDDDNRLAVVAGRDSQRLPDGPWLVAEVEGNPLAVLSLSTGAFVADPFSRAVELRSLLELRAEQLAEREPARGLLGRVHDGLRPQDGPAGDPGAPAAVLGGAPAAPQCCSSGAIVSPADSSCSQYSSAGSRGPLQTVAWPELWIRSA